MHQFEQNAALSYGTDIPYHAPQFVQYVADNVDHNIRTLDGNATFHGMGMIAAVTPGVKKANVILRAKIKPSAVAAMPILFHRDEGLGMSMVKFEKLCSFKAKDPTAYLDILWKCSITSTSHYGGKRP